MSLLSALENLVAKIPTEASTLHHVQWLQELTRGRMVEAVYWVGTRDMIADGMTKGSVPRSLLRRVQEAGKWTLEHEWKRYPKEDGASARASTRQRSSFT